MKDNMKDWMKIKGLSNQTFSEALGVSYCTGVKWATGKSSPRRMGKKLIADKFPDCPILKGG